MQPSEALSASAQLAVALAGFAGVVVSFRRGSVHEWSKIDRFRLLILLSNSALPFLLSILGMLLLGTSLDEQAIWRWCSIVAFVLAVGTAQLVSQTYRTFSRNELSASGSKRSIFYTSAILGLAATLLQLDNVIYLKTFWPFFAAIATWLWLAMIQFVLVVTAAQKQNG